MNDNAPPDTTGQVKNTRGTVSAISHFDGRLPAPHHVGGWEELHKFFNNGIDPPSGVPGKGAGRLRDEEIAEARRLLRASARRRKKKAGPR